MKKLTNKIENCNELLNVLKSVDSDISKCIKLSKRIYKELGCDKKESSKVSKKETLRKYFESKFNKKLVIFNDKRKNFRKIKVCVKVNNENRKISENICKELGCSLKVINKKTHHDYYNGFAFVFPHESYKIFQQ
jgi:thiaminase